jgi:hypothetical protein
MIARDRKRRERAATDPGRAKAAAHIRALIKIFKQMEADERQIAAHMGVKTTGSQYKIERRIEDYEADLRFCCPDSVNPIHLLTRAAQTAWEDGLRWDAKEEDWVRPNVPQSINAEGPLAQVVAAALAFIGEKQKSPNTVEAVLKGRRR